MTVKDKDDKEKDYDISGATVSGDRTKASEIKEGDAVTLTMKGGKCHRGEDTKKAPAPAISLSKMPMERSPTFGQKLTLK